MKKQFEYVDNYKIYFSISIFIMILGFIMFFINGFNFGNDFKGGSKFQIKFTKAVEEKSVREIFEKNNIKVDIIFTSKNNDEVEIKTSEFLDTQNRNKILDELQDNIGINRELTTSKLIGPTIGKDMQNKAILSLVYASIGILIYITLRFEWKFGIAAILSLLHDVFVLVSVYIIFKLPIDGSFIAAILTVVGYSINDTIVIFDRIRDELKYSNTTNLSKIVNYSVSSTMTRSINTTLTTVIVVFVLYIMGVESIKILAFPLMIGIIIGAYSSIFIASPIWLIITNRENKLKNPNKYINKK